MARDVRKYLRDRQRNEGDFTSASSCPIIVTPSFFWTGYLSNASLFSFRAVGRAEDRLIDNGCLKAAN